MGNRRYRRQEQSLMEQIQEHKAKVATELAKDRPNVGLVRHWESEIRAFEAGIGRARKRLRG